MNVPETQHLPRNTKNFIDHLTGLRGVAILLVVLFHIFGQGVWGNGYLGVDIFLVITGYLMFRGRMAKPGLIDWRGFFSYLLRRIRRIVPPMLVIILVSILIGMLLLWWKDAELQSKLGYAACLAKANGVLQREFSNYFAPDSEYMPLLHLWYLSVILQVYLLYAVGNQVLQRLPRKVVIWVLTLLGIASLLYNYSAPLAEWLASMGIPVADFSTKVSYYQTLPRLWEVLAGGLVCILPDFKCTRSSCIAAAAGAVCVLFAVFAPALPGMDILTAMVPSTLLTVFGTVLLLRYTPQCRGIHGILSNKVLLWLGAVSFSLYLVHMPVVVYLRIWTLGQPGLWWSLLMLAVSLPLAYLFMLGIERRRFPLWAIVELWTITLLFCREGRITAGFRNYLPASNWELLTYTGWKMYDDESLAAGLSTEYFPRSRDVFDAMNQLENIPGKVRAPLMVLGSEQKPVTCVLMGDSHAASLYAGVDVALKDEHISGVYFASRFGPFLGRKEDKDSFRNEPTHEKKQAFLRWLHAHKSITHIIVHQRWHNYIDADPPEKEREMRAFLRELRDAGKNVIIIAPAPEFPNQVLLLHLDKAFTLRHITPSDVEKTAAVCSKESYLRINENVLPILYKMRDEGLCTLIEPLNTLRPGEVFRTVQDGKLLMPDDNHMNAGQAIPLVQKLRPALREALR